MKRIFSLFLVTVMAFVFSGCTAPAASQPASIQLKDGLGRLVTLPRPAQKIVSLAPSNTEILFAIGAGKQVVGRDDFSDFPVEAKPVASVGGVQSYNLEAIAKMQPDLVLAAGINSQEQVKSLESLKITVYYLANPIDMNGLYANLKTVGQLSGHEKEASELAASLQKRVQAIETKTAKASSTPKVFYELDGTDPAKPWTAGPGTFVDLLIRKAGGENVGNALSSDWAQISQEALIVANPDIIILGDASYGLTPDQVKTRPGWDGIKAIKTNKLVTFDDNLISRPGPRMVDGLETLVKIIHPELDSPQ
jgi:iron complex transport system substrate-binding protein